MFGASGGVPLEGLFRFRNIVINAFLVGLDGRMDIVIGEVEEEGFLFVSFLFLTCFKVNQKQNQKSIYIIPKTQSTPRI